VLRGSIVYTSLKGLEDGKKQIASKFKVVREKDRFQEGKDQDGYRDVNYNLETSNGHIAEVQLHLQQILDAKSGKGDLGKNENNRSGHEIYEELRTLEAKRKEGYPDVQDKVQKQAQIESADKRIAELKAESRAHYDKALNAAKGASVTKGDDPPASLTPAAAGEEARRDA
jgi:polyhydroxyalkanoate synthesis regulator phasin